MKPYNWVSPFDGFEEYQFHYEVSVLHEHFVLRFGIEWSFENVNELFEFTNIIDNVVHPNVITRPLNSIDFNIIYYLLLLQYHIKVQLLFQIIHIIIELSFLFVNFQFELIIQYLQCISILHSVPIVNIALIQSFVNIEAIEFLWNQFEIVYVLFQP